MSLETRVGEVHDIVISVRHDVVCVVDRTHRVEPMLTAAETDTLVALLQEARTKAAANGKKNGGGK